MKLRRNVIWLIVVALFTMIFAMGCTGSKGSYSPVTPVAEGSGIAKYANVVVEVKSNADISLAAPDKERIQTQIVANLRKEYPNKFKEVNPPKSNEPSLQALVNITRYDKEDNFGSFMGGRQIKADISLNDPATGQCLGKSECKKTFAVGGLVGRSVRIEALEDGFAKAAAASIAEAQK